MDALDVIRVMDDNPQWELITLGEYGAFLGDPTTAEVLCELLRRQKEVNSGQD